MAYGETMKRLSPCSNELMLSLGEKYCPSPKRVLDVACGRGERLLAFAQALPEGKMLGVDIDEDMVAAARRAGDIRLAEASALPYEGESVDLALCECSLSLFPQPEKSLGEMNRVLKKGGILLLGEIFASLGGKKYIDAPDGDALGRIYSRETIEEMCLSSGFSAVEWLDRSGDLAAMAAQMIFDGCFCGCVGAETAKLLMKLKAGYGLWILKKDES